MPSLFWRTDLGPGTVKVAAGRFNTGGDIAAAEGSRVYLLVPSDGEYSMYSVYDLNEKITGLTAVRVGNEAEGIAVTTPDRVVVLGSREGALALAADSGQEPGADFTDVAAGDLDGDGRDEIVAAAPGRESVYVYRLAGGAGEALSLELAGIRAVPGVPRHVAVLNRADGINVIAVAYAEDEKWGVATYRLTEEGFEEGPALAGQPLGISSMAAGNVLERPGAELALGSLGGMVWLVGAGPALEVLLVTDSLGTTVSALASSGGNAASLGAGTPEGNVFIFDYPVKRAPDQVFSPSEGVTGLAFLPGERVAVGTVAGGLQVWLRGIQGTWDYTVKPGDTLWSISLRVGAPVERILSANEGTIKNPEMIVPGQVIRIPAGNGG